jgi:NAD(P)-dependent dehydrogenase (short-subunit alcohol dehydrogenase family)
VDLGLAGAASVVVGGTRGLGLATAEALAREGSRVAIIARDEGRLAECAARLLGIGSPDTMALPADVSSDDQLDRAFGQIAERWGELNVLVVSAGPDVSGRAEDLSGEDWHSAFEVGAVGPARCVIAALPLLRSAAWARVVTVTAMSVKHQSPSLVSYTAAKSALASITKNLARSLAPDGILVNAVAPGPMLTGWAKAALGDAADNLDPVEAFRRLQRGQSLHVDLERIGTPEEVAAVVVFCASRTNSYMTGAHLNVDGGSDFC